MRAIIYQHEPHEGLGQLEPALKRAGFEVVTRFRGTVYREDTSAELLVILGGPMGVNDATEHPFLRDELAVITDRLTNDRPCLGLCLGAQLMAASLGAEVLKGKNGRELGVAPVRWTTEALADPVIAGVSPKTAVAHWHEDTWKPIAGATLLASTDRYTQQAFKYGNSYAFQFHPELNAAQFETWLDTGVTDATERTTLKAQLGKLKGAERELEGLLSRLADHFVRAA